MDQPPSYSAVIGQATAPGFHSQSQTVTEKSAMASPQGMYPPPSQPYPPQGFSQPGYPPNQGYVPNPGYPPNQGYPPPGVQGYAPGSIPPQAQYVHPPPGATVVVTSPPIIAGFGPQSQSMGCPHCHSHISTKTLTEPSMKTHLFALFLCLIGCIPCCLIPYCVDSCQNKNHYCPNCNAFLGAYDDSGFRGRF